ncbi:MAG: hypothetical protein MAG453_02117 [Calditrichaeota bacterium]|nr:hypothetical protein [Calditrichota bacterium]
MKRMSLAAILPLALLLAACGPKPEMQKSALDTPDYHVSQGLRHLDHGRLEQAAAEFDRAIALEPDYARALAGMALVHGQREEFNRARELADDAVGEDRHDPFVWAARGRVRSLATDPGAEFDDEDFSRAVELDPEFDLAWYWWGRAKQRAWEFSSAGEKFERAIELRGEWSSTADAAYADVQKIVRASPGTRVGARIAQLDTLGRADLAVLFLEELKLAEVYERHAGSSQQPRFEPPEDPTRLPETRPAAGDTVPADARGHWAETWVTQAIELGVMEVAPDRRFYPDRPVTRGEFALFLQNILATVLHDESLATKYIGERSRFSDMRSGSATYNAAALAVDRGFMDATLTGRFKPEATVSGAEALLSIREFQKYLEYEF